ncbi:MAG: alpha/beta fold hydrolase [Eubacteriales bacterium]|nr:alpha/beta fold hydrolase [Eubacteriales bacterium]
MKKSKHKITTFAILFAIATAIIHIINKFISATASLKEMLDTTGRNYYTWRYGELYYKKRGKGSPILLVHDMQPGASGYEWRQVEKALAANHTVYTLDLLGCGRSDKPGITYTNFVYVQMICDFIKNVIGEKTDVIASGFSGSFIIMACRNEKESFNKIMLVNPSKLSSLKQMPAQKDKLLKCIIEIPVFGTLIYHMIVSRESLNDLFIENLFYNPFHIDKDMVDAYYEAAHKGGYYAKYVYASFASKLMNIDISSSLKVIDQSIFIIEGESESNGISIIKDYCELNPAIESTIIKKSKHFPHVENPDKFLEQVDIFFS